MSAPLDLSRKLLQDFEAAGPTQVSSVPGASMTTEMEDFTASILSGISPAKGGTKDRSLSGGVAGGLAGDGASRSTTGAKQSSTTIPVPRTSTLSGSPYARDAKAILRESQDEVTELRKALLTASQAVFSAQQELRVEKQKAMTLEAERNKAVSGIRSVHKLMEDRETELSIERTQRDRREEDAQESMATLRAKVVAIEERNSFLEGELSEVKSRQVQLLEDLGDSQVHVKKLSSSLSDAKEYINRKNQEVGKADAFVEGSLNNFLRDASQFAAQWKTLRSSLDTFSTDPTTAASTGGGDWGSPQAPNRRSASAALDLSTTATFSPRHQQEATYSDPTVGGARSSSVMSGRGLVQDESSYQQRSSSVRYSDRGDPVRSAQSENVEGSTSLLAGTRWSSLAVTPTQGLSSYSRGPSTDY